MPVRAAYSRADVMLVEDRTGIAVLQSGRLSRVLAFTVADGLVTQISVLADPGHLRGLALALSEN